MIAIKTKQYIKYNVKEHLKAILTLTAYGYEKCQNVIIAFEKPMSTVSIL